jgi:hypothetical protein
VVFASRTERNFLPPADNPAQELAPVAGAKHSYLRAKARVGRLMSLSRTSSHYNAINANTAVNDNNVRKSASG